MTDNPQDIPREQRRTGRTGPLGEDPEETSRQETSGSSGETTSPGDDETRQIPTNQQPAAGSEDRTRQVPTNEDSSTSDERETRVIRTDGKTDAEREEDPYSGQSRRERREAGRTAPQDTYPRG